ncbi:MAG: hypothetical protein HGA45_42065 [Chloroflexales bacterium]|nr:hypothetical protein [Chloroflexales bacterium]
MVDLFSARGVQIIGLLNGPSPGWATGRGGPSFFPPDPQQFAAFAQAAAARYRGRIRYWQIWNEPDNVRYWQPAPDTGAYINLLKAAYPAIKAADPDAQVLAASLVSPQPAAGFLRQVYAGGAWGFFDIIALNPYTDPRSPEQGQIGVAGIGAVSGMIEALGPKPIWVTEFGWSTGPADRTMGQGAPIDETTQANYLVRGAALLRAAGAERVLWYNLKDTEAVDGAPHNLYGLVRYDQTMASYDPSLKKAAFNVFQVMARELAGTSAAMPLDLSGQAAVLDFENLGSWRIGDQDNGSFGPTGERVHGGKGAGKLTYSFSGEHNDFVVFKAAAPLPLPANSSKLSLWISGDGSSHALKVWLRDSQGEVLQLRLGPVGGPSWHVISAPLGGQVASSDVIENKQNLRLDFPVSLTAIALDDDPDTASGSGTIYLDDLSASTGAESYAVRFPRGGEVIDVVWATQPTQVAVPTRSGQATLVRAWGETTVVQASAGQLVLNVGPDPVYLHHVPATMPDGDQRCFPETSQCISGRIREYWEQYGGLPIFGFPITEPRTETVEGQPRQVQWFERARLELHPELKRPYDVQLSRLGSDRLAQQGVDWQAFPKSAPQAGCRFFAETSHNICGRILETWRTRGIELDGKPGKSEAENLALFGLPLSDLQTSEGQQVQVQWFERGRIELTPGKSPPADVQLGLLGSEVLAGR